MGQGERRVSPLSPKQPAPSKALAMSYPPQGYAKGGPVDATESSSSAGSSAQGGYPPVPRQMSAEGFETAPPPYTEYNEPVPPPMAGPSYPGPGIYPPHHPPRKGDPLSSGWPGVIQRSPRGTGPYDRKRPRLPPAHVAYAPQQNEYCGAAYPQYPPNPPPGAVGGYPPAARTTCVTTTTTTTTRPYVAGVATGTVIRHSTNIFTTIDVPTAIRFENVEVRHVFVRKVYTILLVQMVIIFGVSLPFFTNNDVRKYVSEHDTLIVAAYASIGVTFFFGCICAENWKWAPGKYTCLVILTANLAFLFATNTGYFQSEAPLEMALSAAIINLTFFLLTYQEKMVFSHSSGILLVMCASVILGALSAIIVSFLFTWPYRVGNSITASIAALILCLDQAYNLGLMVAGERSAPITMEHEIYAAIKLFLNLVLLPVDSVFILLEFSDYLFGWRGPRKANVTV